MVEETFKVNSKLAVTTAMKHLIHYFYQKDGIDIVKKTTTIPNNLYEINLEIAILTCRFFLHPYHFRNMTIVVINSSPCLLTDIHSEFKLKL